MTDVVELSGPTLRRGSGVVGYRYAETIGDGLTGNDVHVLPMGLGWTKITCAMVAGAGSGSIEFTTSSDADVLAQTAEWRTWPLGVVTGTKFDAVLSQVTGLRGRSASGEIEIIIVA